MKIYSLIYAAALSFHGATALAAWSPEGVTIRATSDPIVHVAAVADGNRGTLVAWQEGTLTSGWLRIQHVLSTGQVDPAWPSNGVLLCDAQVSSRALTMLSDAKGGAYVWWMEGNSIYVTRVASSGVVAPGWSARGRRLGGVVPPEGLPCIVEDGSGGLYAAWATLGPSATDNSKVEVSHLGPSNTPAGGFPATRVLVSPDDAVPTWEFRPAITPSWDGGAFVAWPSWSENPAVTPGAIRMRRLRADGSNAGGWPLEGLAIAPFTLPPGSLDPYTDWTPLGAGLVDLCSDGEGGVYLLHGHLASTADPYAFFGARLRHLRGNGQTREPWPAEGEPILQASFPLLPEGSFLRVMRDSRGRVQVAVPSWGSHAIAWTFVVEPFDSWFTGGARVFIDRNDFVVNASGGVFLAECTPADPWSQYEPLAHLFVTQSAAPPGWTDFNEVRDDGPWQWYGDVALAQSGDGGAIFFWSQMRERLGLFARKFDGPSTPTGVGENRAELAPGLDHLRFVAGEGVRAAVVVPAGESASLDLYDVTGRRIAGTRLAASAGAREITLAGTRTLASGIYFLRLEAAGESRAGKVFVAR